MISDDEYDKYDKIINYNYKNVFTFVKKKKN